MDPFVQLAPAAYAQSCARGVIVQLLIINNYGLEYIWYMVKLASMMTSQSDRRPADVLHTTDAVSFL